jgi:hypothetical protein
MNRFNRIHVREFNILELITWDSLITYVPSNYVQVGEKCNPPLYWQLQYGIKVLLH